MEDNSWMNHPNLKGIDKTKTADAPGADRTVSEQIAKRAAALFAGSSFTV